MLKLRREKSLVIIDKGETMFEWRELFIPTILDRGKKIAESNIYDVHVTEEGLRAKVKGTEEYELLIRTSLNEITCSCPFALQNNLACKHMAALLLFCENNWSSEIAEFFNDSENKPLGKLAIKHKMERLEKEQIFAKKQLEKAEKQKLAYEKYQERLAKESQRQATQLERALLLEKRRKEREALEEARRVKREEREKKRIAKQREEEERLKKIKEERRLALENAAIMRKEWEARLKKEAEEAERLRPIREANEKREAERAEQEAEERRQKEIDKRVARKRRSFPKGLKDELAEIEERIKKLEDAERDPGGGEFGSLTERQRLEETGWYYSDIDEVEGFTVVDKYGNETFIPDGFHPESN